MAHRGFDGFFPTQNSLDTYSLGGWILMDRGEKKRYNPAV
jgi:hypothetical protein